MFGASGVYLCFPELLQDFADRLQPPTAANAGIRIVDQIIYWLAYLHFGRINGIGIPCNGPGLCDQSTKAVWAVFGLAPAAMFVTGAIMWWNRVLRPRPDSRSRRAKSRRLTGELPDAILIYSLGNIRRRKPIIYMEICYGHELSTRSQSMLTSQGSF